MPGLGFWGRAPGFRIELQAFGGLLSCANQESINIAFGESKSDLVSLKH